MRWYVHGTLTPLTTDGDDADVSDDDCAARVDVLSLSVLIKSYDKRVKQYTPGVSSFAAKRRRRIIIIIVRNRKAPTSAERTHGRSRGVFLSRCLPPVSNGPRVLGRFIGAQECGPRTYVSVPMTAR